MKSQTLEEPNLLQELRTSATSRRSFLKAMGAAGLGVAAVMLLDGCGGGNSNNGGGGSFPLQNLPGNTNDQKILNYALTLEYLEADLYRQALNLASGKALTAPLSSNPSDYTIAVSGGGLDAFNTAAGFAYLRDFAFVEARHAQFLKTALSGVPSVSANAKGYTFGSTVAANIKAILTAILPLEETGVRAYLGAGQYFNDLLTLQTAVSIYSTEARHSSAINYILGIDPGPYTLAGDKLLYPIGTGVSSNTFEHFLEPATVVSAIQKFIVK
ncbi:ferritin-like domain-containing protein [bacterium]|nr:MAG: ferritin-like domain-containing protein [bacterium]